MLLTHVVQEQGKIWVTEDVHQLCIRVRGKQWGDWAQRFLCMWNLPHVLQKCTDTRPYQRVYKSMSLDSRLASILYFLVLLRDLVFRLSVPVNRLTGTYTVDLRLPILPFTSFIGHFVPHSHFLLELNQSIVTTWSTVLMPVEACRINPVNDRLWLEAPALGRWCPWLQTDVTGQQWHLMSEKECGVPRRYSCGHHYLTQTQWLQMTAAVWKPIYRKKTKQKSPWTFHKNATQGERECLK